MLVHRLGLPVWSVLLPVLAWQPATCSQCDGRPVRFTNFSYAVTGMLRNGAIFANADPAALDSYSAQKNCRRTIILAA